MWRLGLAVLLCSVGTAQAQEFQIPGEPGDPLYEFFRRFQIPMPQGDGLRRIDPRGRRRRVED